jgi:hypothetical protein
MGERFDYVRVLSVERNACDFCIAYYLGEYLHANPLAECVILSKDKKGFDPLVNHLKVERGFKVRRVSAQKEAFAEIPGSTPKTSFERLTGLLKKSPTTLSSPSLPTCGYIFATPRALGSEGATRIRTDCCDSTTPRCGSFCCEPSPVRHCG